MFKLFLFYLKVYKVKKVYHMALKTDLNQLPDMLQSLQKHPVVWFWNQFTMIQNYLSSCMFYAFIVAVKQSVSINWLFDKTFIKKFSMSKGNQIFTKPVFGHQDCAIIHSLSDCFQFVFSIYYCFLIFQCFYSLFCLFASPIVFLCQPFSISYFCPHLTFFPLLSMFISFSCLHLESLLPVYLNSRFSPSYQSVIQFSSVLVHPFPA